MKKGPVLIVGALVAVAVVLVAMTLRRPDIETYAPTAATPRAVGTALVGPVLFTIDATHAEQWQRFSFQLGAAVSGEGWDLAFRRYQVIANGGKGYAGNGGVRDLGAARFDAVDAVPADGYQPNDGGPDPRNPAMASWYTYSYFSHLLMPKPHVWAIRTADGRYAKLEMVGYYCPGGQPGCVTFRYVYQGDGSTNVRARTAPTAGAALR
ncbi:MAG: HmuY family protein [Candidatus Rokubacteria bacterium]|nr:HmuY family protein [Candidatus Rokubacteria bacterium]